MPTRTTNNDSDWSDDEQSEIETSVLLGYPDGVISKQEDIDDAAVSRVGGHPAFLTSTEPPITSSQCKNCSFPMALLVQLWCPLEGSTMDRALYVFGCSRRECQRKDGSIRAFRSLRYNAKYAAKLEAKAARRREKEAALAKEREKEEQRKAAAKVNPFSMKTGTQPAGGLFGGVPSFGATSSNLGSQLFSAKNDTTTEDSDDNAPPPPSDAEDESDDDGSESEESEKSVLAAPASTPASSSPWSAAPAYKPLYLSTALEYIPPPPKVKTKGIDVMDEGTSATGGKSRKAEERAEKEEQAAWNNAMEGYEDSMEVDKVFERFARRIGYEGEQCIRYELGGTPLPFANDSHFDSLFPSPSKASPQAAATAEFGNRIYDPDTSVISACSHCGGRRVFECQVVPHLISVLEHQKDSDSSTKSSQQSSTNKDDGGSTNDIEARKKELERLLKGGEGAESMEWGTAMVFSCKKDCCVANGKEAKETWAEELVLVQWEE